MAVTKAAASRHGYHTVVSSPIAPERDFTISSNTGLPSGTPAPLPFGQVDGLALLMKRPGVRLWEQARSAGVPIATFNAHPPQSARDQCEC